MDINFNNLRIQAFHSYSRLVNKLNDKLLDEDGEINSYNEIYNLHADDIQKDMDNLRSLLCTIACCYKPGDEEFIDLSEHCDNVPVFNPEKDEDE